MVNIRPSSGRATGSSPVSAPSNLNRREVILTPSAAPVSAIDYSDFQSVITAITGQIDVGSVVGVLAAAAGVCIGLVFMWWGVRKVTRMVMSAFRKGKISP